MIKDLPGYEGYYHISSDGKLYSLHKRGIPEEVLREMIEEHKSFVECGEPYDVGATQALEEALSRITNK